MANVGKISASASRISSKVLHRRRNLVSSALLAQTKKLHLSRADRTNGAESSTPEGEGGEQRRTDHQDADRSTHSDDRLYPNHIPTSCVQKAILAVGSAGLSLASPWRDDMVAVMGEVTGEQAARYMLRQMRNDPVGLQILQDRPRINSMTVDLDYLKTLPPATFGREYSDFLDSQHIHPDARRPVQFVDDVELAYVMQRYREVHDMFHVLLGMPTHILGEVVVKWVEGIQLRLPLGLLGGLFGALRLKPKQRALYQQEHLWWALRVGRNTHFLMNIYYEKHWEQDIHDMRCEFNIEEPPASTPPKRW